MIHYEMMAKNDPKDRVSGFKAEYKKKLDRILRNKEALSIYKKPYNELTDAQKQTIKKGKNFDSLEKSQQEEIEKEYKKIHPDYIVQPENVDNRNELVKLASQKPIKKKKKGKSTKLYTKVENKKDTVYVLSENTTEECENIPYALEEGIEDLLEKNIEILERDAFIIGRQVETGYGRWIDLVAIDKDANIIIIELKKAKTDHYVLSQIFDYWSWVEKLKQEEINDNIAKSEHNGKNHLDEFKSIEDKFTHHFKKKPTAWNSKQKLIIVGEQIDVQTKEQASTLAKRNVNVECVELNAYRNTQGKIVVVRYIPL